LWLGVAVAWTGSVQTRGYVPQVVNLADHGAFVTTKRLATQGASHAGW